MWIEAEPVYGALVSLAIGLIIGLERGWQVRQLGDNQRIAGMRTYGLIGLLGGVCALLLPTLGSWLPLLGLLAVVAGCGLSVWLAQRWQGEFGLTSSVAMVLTYLLGLMSVLQSPSEAVACAVLAALLMGLKGKIQQGMLFLSETEFHATLRFLLISLVLLPVLPDAEMGPLDAFNPFKIWLMVVIIAGISFCGHFAVRLLGTRAGLVLTSMLAGLASSTALTLQFARLNKEQGGLERLLATGILLAGATMWLRLLMLVLLIHSELAMRLAVPLLLLAAIVYGFAFWFWRQRKSSPTTRCSQKPATRSISPPPSSSACCWPSSASWLPCCRARWATPGSICWHWSPASRTWTPSPSPSPSSPRRSWLWRWRPGAYCSPAWSTPWSRGCWHW